MTEMTGESPTERSTWTEERVAQFRELHALGLSYGQIAREMGGITRNAAVGKATRMGLPARGPRKKLPRLWEAEGVSERTWQRRKAKASGRTFPRQSGASGNKPVYRRNTRTSGHNFEAVGIGNNATDLEPEVIADPVKFVDLEPHHCRWPVSGSGAEMLCCGVDKFPGFSYCSGHCRMAYVAPRSHKVQYFSNFR